MVRSSDVALLVCVFGSHSGLTIKGRTRIQKTVCVLKYSAKVPFEFDFHSYFYGPYSDDLTDAINGLVGMKILDEKIVPTDYGSYRYEYELTKEGWKFYEKVKKKLESSTLQIVDSEVKKLEETRTKDLVSLAKIVSNMPSII